MTERKVALVTGATRGIGRSTALELARNGYDVVVNFSRSRDAAQAVADEAKAFGARTLLAPADVADEAAVLAMVAAIKKDFGRLDALVNNAGTTIPTPPSPRHGGLGPRVRGERARHVPGDARVRASAQRIRLGRDRQPLQHRRAEAGATAVSICREQGRRG
jgi:NAD(P)-dependent dehydrogenase (short-subunit alcohol dehydrogenase family)